MNIGALISRGKHLIDANSTTILTTMGVTGTITTAVLVGRASFKAAEIIAKETEDLKQQFPDDIADPRMNREMSTQDKVKLVWREYLPAAGVGLTTVTAIIMSNRIASKKIAGLVVAQGISEKAFREYKEKVVEKFGANKDRDVRNEVAQDRVNRYPVESREVILAGMGEVLCFDETTGRYFKSSVEEIKRAENKINFNIVNHMSYASLSEFYQEIGLPPTAYSDQVGFNLDNRIEVSFSTVMSSDQRPCVAINFHFPPIAEYARTY